MYSYVEENGKGGKPASHPKNITRKTIKHGDYKNELFNKQQIYHKMKTIRSMNYLLGCFKLNKVSLKCFDDKRYIHEHGRTSYACRNYKI